jgi:transcriptional regulator with XRE-family HTH domain
MPEQDSESRAFGEAIARLRVRKGWSRPQLVQALCREFDKTAYEKNYPSEQTIHRIETGQVVKLSRQLIDALIQVLECDSRERAKLLLLADRNPIVGIRVDRAVMEEFLYLIDEVYRDFCVTIENLSANQPVNKLPQPVVREIFCTRLEAMIAKYRSS